MNDFDLDRIVEHLDNLPRHNGVAWPDYPHLERITSSTREEIDKAIVYLGYKFAGDGSIDIDGRRIINPRNSEERHKQIRDERADATRKLLALSK